MKPVRISLGREPITVLLCALVAIAIARPVAAEETIPAAVQPFVGTWVHTGGSAEEQARRDAIEAAIADLPAMIRPMVRKKLTAGTAIVNSLTIEVAGSELTIGETGGESLTTPVDGSTVEVKRKGKTARVRREGVDGSLRKHAVMPDSWATIVFRLSEDGRTMTVLRQVGSDRLPKAVLFEATYTRQ